MTEITVYTRNINSDEYPFGLAKAVHFSIGKEGRRIPLNRNYGILFAPGDISEANTIIPLGIDEPRIYRSHDGSIMVCGRRITESGQPYETDFGRLWCWQTTDLIRFKTIGLVEESELSGYDLEESLETDETMAKEALEFWDPPTGDIDPEHSKYRFPLAEGYGDPVIFSRDGKWYFISTNDNTDDIGIYVREADTVQRLFDKETEQHLILPYDPDRNLIQTFWAPELHLIGDELYILFAVSGKQWGPQCHMMKLKKGGSIIDPDSWYDPVKVLKKDGSPLARGAITLDMTYIKAGKGSYVVWSYREHIMDPLDTGSMLYIASVDEKQPWKLTSDPQLLSRPLFGWENVAGTINNEGPYAFIRGNTVYLTYSGGSANAYTYAVGLFTADYNADMLDPASWTKRTAPILTFYNVDEFGPGHNSFFTDENGDLMIAYHAETGIKEHLRCDMIRRVCFKKDGTPYFVLAH
ncbi:MAG: family 43 glycosylhydrolase [Lachnospiraceae bacterium]|nr:family 43 glycosylhydrolase [Lachnospiraceae bacterium]